MEQNTTPQGGFWMQTEDITEETTKEANQTSKEEKDKFKDWYEFFPDASL